MKVVKLDDLLKLLPEDDVVGPKPTWLREKITDLAFEIHESKTAGVIKDDN